MAIKLFANIGVVTPDSQARYKKAVQSYSCDFETAAADSAALQIEHGTPRTGTSSGFMTMHPMNTFDPRRPCKVHDALNDCMVDWKPEWVGNYREYAEPFDTPGVIAWDGLLLDGWQESNATAKQ